MKKIFVFFCSILFFNNLYCGVVWDFYAGATAGAGNTFLSIPSLSNDNKFSQSYGGIFGVDIPFMRIEAEYNHVNSKDTNLDIGFINTFFKMSMPIFKPYIGIGLGRMFKGKVSFVDLTDKYVYQGMLGGTLDIPALPFDIDLEVRGLYSFRQYNIPLIGDKTVHFGGYEARVKARYVF